MFVNATDWAVALREERIECRGRIAGEHVLQVAEWYASQLKETGLFWASFHPSLPNGYTVVARPLRPISIARALLDFGGSTGKMIRK